MEDVTLGLGRTGRPHPDPEMEAAYKEGDRAQQKAAEKPVLDFVASLNRILEGVEMGISSDQEHFDLWGKVLEDFLKAEDYVIRAFRGSIENANSPFPSNRKFMLGAVNMALENWENARTANPPQTERSTVGNRFLFMSLLKVRYAMEQITKNEEYVPFEALS